MIKSLTINGFRGFGEEKTINFVIPNGNPGSGLNVLVGPNNSGKTSIIECIRMYHSSSDNISLSEGKRNIKNNSIVDIFIEGTDNDDYRVKTIESGGSQVDVTGDQNKHIPFVLQSRRAYQYYMGKSWINTREGYLDNIESNINSGSRSSILSMYESRIFEWNKKKDKFDTVLKKIIKEDFDWYIELNELNQYYIKILFSNGAIVHTSEGLGDGFWSLFTIVDALYDSSENDIIVIDEPELSLHPSFQMRVLSLLEEYSKDRQIIIATHSTYFISLESIKNGGGLIRTYKDSSANICIGCIDDEDRQLFSSLLSNLNNPHILGIKAKELFFSEDNILVTEGQDDAIIIPHVCKELNIDLSPYLFGYGAGGAENIPKVMHLLKNLGYKKVSALFDGDKEEVYNSAKESFPDYHCELLFKDDIRDKDAINKPFKEGVVNNRRSIKDENKQPFIEMINRINEYHSN